MWSGIKKNAVNFLKIAFPLVLGGLLLWYIYKDIEFGQIARVLNSDIRYGYLLLSLVFGLGANMLRGLRWGLLVEPLGYRPRKVLLMLAVVGNYGVNLVLPRVGEVWRCGIVAKYDNQPFSKLFGTLIVDRLYDVIAIAVIFALSFVLTPGFYASLFKEEPSAAFSLHDVLLWGGVLLAALALVCGAFVVIRHFAFYARIQRFFANVFDGLRSFWTMKHKGRFLAYTIAVWGCYFLYFYLTFFAFGFTRELSPAYGFAIFMLTCAGIMVPVQGGVGPWHFVVILGLTSLGVVRSDAAAFALIVLTLQTLWVALTGFACVLAIPIIYNKPKTPPR